VFIVWLTTGLGHPVLLREKCCQVGKVATSQEGFTP
jgi:hypothetical protein